MTRRGSWDLGAVLRRRSMRRLPTAVLAVMAAMVVAPQAAMAWKPYTHIYTGNQAFADAEDGTVAIGNHTYPIAPDLRAALKNNRAAYNAGVVGPDGFPDIVFGQSVIHPLHTGAWLQYLMQQARAAQTSTMYSSIQKKQVPTYSPAEKAQILAFSYGYLTHAAGDMWGHTLINDFAGGVFPSLTDLADASKAKIALRHIVAESYVGSATPGWDRKSGAKHRRSFCVGFGPTPAKCDTSDDITPAVSLQVPTRFIYKTFVNPYQPLPVRTCGNGTGGTITVGCPGGPFSVGDAKPQRGKLLDYFLDLEAGLQLDLQTKQADGAHLDCASGTPYCHSVRRDLVLKTVRGNRKVVVTQYACDAKQTCTYSAADRRADAYEQSTAGKEYQGWLRDIQDGLEHWGDFSLGIAKALFDPQARRDAQNAECHSLGEERDSSRIDCENDIGALDTINYETREYVNHHLFLMLGAPSVVGEARENLHDLSTWFDEHVGRAANPLRWIRDTVEDKINALVKEKIREATGLDYDGIRSFLEHPGRWMCGKPGAIALLPGAGAIFSDRLFPDGDAQHKRLDELMHLPANHHQVAKDDCSDLKENAQFDPTKFAAIKDTITQAKLLLLSGTELNHALGDVLHDAGIIKDPSLVHTYPADGNVMYTPLAPASVSWLDLIDGDHAWRSDGLPRFCDTAPRPGSTVSSCKTAVTAMAAYPHKPTAQTGTNVSAGGTGTYPLWESCVLRPAFRTLFSDWENAANSQPNFPDLGDAPSLDPATDPNPPTITEQSSGLTTSVNGTRLLAPGATITITANDDVFTDAAVKISYRVYYSGLRPPDFQAVPNGGTFTFLPIARPGPWVLQVMTVDPCRTQTKTDTFEVL
jgi:hypothetical protein